jgi:hypothetical protein
MWEKTNSNRLGLCQRRLAQDRRLNRQDLQLLALPLLLLLVLASTHQPRAGILEVDLFA